MASTAKKLKAERRMRELLAEENLPQPDEVEYGLSCVRLFWHGTKVVVVVDVDEDGEIGRSRRVDEDGGRDAELETADKGDDRVVDFPSAPAAQRRKLRRVDPDDDQWPEDAS
jgi:hypothetical protein